MRLLFVLMFLIGLPAAVWANRVALVIGNSKYQSVAELPNPENDSDAISKALIAQGFEVITGNNLDRDEMRNALREFRSLADRSDIALVYNAGHGIEIAGQNYLVPVDARLEDERDAGLEIINVDLVLRQISGASRMKMVVLDACRNNPFAAQMKRQNVGRNVGRGLTIVDSAEADTLIAYAAAAGEITPDGEIGENSPFTRAFLTALAGPPSDIRRMLGAVRDQMRQSVPGAAPFIYSSLGGGEYVINSENNKTEPVESTETVPNMISQDFVATDQSQSVANWDAFLVKYEVQNQHLLYAFALQRRQALLDGAETAQARQVAMARAIEETTAREAAARAREEEATKEREALQAAIDLLTEQNATVRAAAAAAGAAFPSDAVAVNPPATVDEAARDLQTLLKGRGCYSGAIDGIFGRGSTSGLASFLKAAGVPSVARRNPPLLEMVGFLAILKENPTIRCPARTVSRKTTSPAKSQPLNDKKKRSWDSANYCTGSVPGGAKVYAFC